MAQNDEPVGIGFDETLAQEKYRYLVEHEHHFGVVVLIRLYRTLNLKSLARLFGKSESTTLTYVQDLLEEELIEVTSEADSKRDTKRRGPKKFYTITPITENVFKSRFRPFDYPDVEGEISKFAKLNEERIKARLIQQVKMGRAQYESIIQRARGLAIINQAIENAVFKRVDRMITDIGKMLDENTSEEVMMKSISPPLGEFNVVMDCMHVADANHVAQFIHLYNDFLKRFSELREKIEKDIKKRDIDENKLSTQHVYFFAGPLDRGLFE